MKSSSVYSEIFSLLVSIVLALVFFASAAGKMMSFSAFEYDIQRIGVIMRVNVPAVPLFCGFDILCEFFIAASLLSRIQYKNGLKTCVVLSIAFIIISAVKASAIGDFSCGCFGKMITLSSPVILTMNFSILFASLLLLKHERRRFYNFHDIH